MRFEFDIEPVEQARPRAVRFGTGVRMYDPKKVAVYKKQLGYLARHEMQERGLKPFDGELAVRFEFYRQVQSSLSKTERARRLSGVHRPTVKPDLSNYIKALEDGLNGIIWIDDNRIVQIVAEKKYSDRPYIVIEVNKVDEVEK